MTADLRVLYYSDKAAFVLGVADLREQRRRRHQQATARRGVWFDAVLRQRMGDLYTDHAAAESDPNHVLAAVRRWRGAVERHRSFTPMFEDDGGPSPRCTWCLTRPGERIAWPCPDLTETADEALAYLGGAA